LSEIKRGDGNRLTPRVNAAEERIPRLRLRPCHTLRDRNDTDHEGRLVPELGEYFLDNWRDVRNFREGLFPDSDNRIVNWNCGGGGFCSREEPR